MAVPSGRSAREMRERLAIDESSSVPLYVQLRDRMRALASKLVASARFPSETEVIAATGLSRITVRRALADLTQEGVLYTRRGRGTFVAAEPDEEALQAPEGFSRVMTRLGHVPSSIVRSAIGATATQEIANHLGLAEDDSIIVLERLRLMSGKPCMLEIAHLPASLVPGLLEHDLSGSLYDLLASEYGLTIASGTERITAVAATRAIAAVLDVEAHTPLLSTVRITWTESGYPIEYTRRTARADLMAFRINLGPGSWLGPSVRSSLLDESAATSTRAFHEPDRGDA